MIKDYRLLALLLLITCAILGISILMAMKGDWRQHQTDYYKGLGIDDYRIEIVQQNIDTPKGVLIDRCVTCHTGASNSDAAGFEQPLAAHSPIVPGETEASHDFSKIGCVVCHDGNGRGLEEADAHGHLAHWQAPLLTGHMTQANCSRCHATINTDLDGAPYLNEGRRLFIEKECWACHAIEDVSVGTRGPNLSEAGSKFSASYLRASIVDPRANIDSSKMPKFDWIDGSDASNKAVEALVVYLKSQHTSNLRDVHDVPPEFRGPETKGWWRPATASATAGKAIFDARTERGDIALGGCVNCHSYTTASPKLVNGTLTPQYEGASIGPDLAFTLASRGKSYVKDHIADPNRHVIDSIMPKFVNSGDPNSFTEVELESLALYLQSLNPKPASREPEMLYAMYCVSCHGADYDGKGRLNAENMLLDPMPRNFRHQFVLAYEDRLADSIKKGILGTAMPPWENLLSDAEVDSLVKHIKERAVEGLDLDGKPFKRPEVSLPIAGGTDRMTDKTLAAGDAEAGEATFARVCTGCHGKLANGKGPNAYFLEHPLPRNLINREYMNQDVITDERLYESIFLGVPGTPMPSHDRVVSDQGVLDIIAYLRALNKLD